MTTEREAFEVWHAEWRARVSAREPTPTEAWFAACAWQKEKDAKLCEAYAIDRHALYKGKPPYTGKELQARLAREATELKRYEDREAAEFKRLSAKFAKTEGRTE